MNNDEWKVNGNGKVWHCLKIRTAGCKKENKKKVALALCQNFCQNRYKRVCDCEYKTCLLSDAQFSNGIHSCLKIMLTESGNFRFVFLLPNRGQQAGLYIA